METIHTEANTTVHSKTAHKTVSTLYLLLLPFSAMLCQFVSIVSS